MGMNKEKKITKIPKGLEHLATNEGGKKIGTKNSKDFAKLRNVRENTKKALS